MENLVDPEKITFEVSSEADADAIAGFYRKYYPNLPWSRGYLDWQYYQNPAGKARNWVARCQGKIVASYTAVPFEIFVRGEIRKGWRMQDLLTRPEYGGLGIYHMFSRMANKFLMVPEYPFNFTFPNERSHNGFMKTGWKAVFRIPLRILALNSHKAVSGNAQAVPVNSFDSQADDIWKSYSRRIDFGINRSARFLNWRYLSRPQANYFPFILSSPNDHLVLILKYYDREDGTRWAHICDLFQAENDSGLTESALHCAIRFAADHQCQAISCWTPTGSQVESPMEKNGFVLQKELSRWFVINANDPVVALHYQRARWHLSMGDSDVY